MTHHLWCFRLLARNTSRMCQRQTWSCSSRASRRFIKNSVCFKKWQLKFCKIWASSWKWSRKTSLLAQYSTKMSLKWNKKLKCMTKVSIRAGRITLSRSLTFPYLARLSWPHKATTTRPSAKAVTKTTDSQTKRTSLCLQVAFSTNRKTTFRKQQDSTSLPCHLLRWWLSVPDRRWILTFKIPQISTLETSSTPQLWQRSPNVGLLQGTVKSAPWRISQTRRIRINRRST